MIPLTVLQALASELRKEAQDSSGAEALRQRLVQGRFKRIRKTLERQGVEVGTGHKRLVVPKSLLAEEDITRRLGFVPVTAAIPEAGQTKLRSFRHPDLTHHIHEHGDVWTIHRDEHPASTMLLKKLLMQRAAAKEKLRGAATGKKAKETATKVPSTLRVGAEAVKTFAQGLPHVVTEGVPGAYYYLKGQATGARGMAERLHEELPREYFRRIRRWRPVEAEKAAAQVLLRPHLARIRGLVQPRIATPRSPGVELSNPFRGNWFAPKTAASAPFPLDPIGMATGVALLGGSALLARRTRKAWREADITPPPAAPESVRALRAGTSWFLAPPAGLRGAGG